MKLYRTLIAASALVLGLSACQEEQIGLFGDEHFLHFKQESSKPYRFSFATVPGKEEIEYKIPLTLIGKALESDTEYELEVVTKGAEGELVTTAPKESYSFASKNVFKAGVFEDSLAVTFKNVDALSEEKVLVLKIVDNEYFAPGPAKYNTAVIYLSNYLVRPDWWDADMETIFLGPYSQIKYQQFILATGMTDLSGQDYYHIVAYVSDFVYYLRDLDAKGQTVYEEDGVTKVLSSVPYAKKI